MDASKVLNLFQDSTLIYIFFLVTRGVRVSLRAPQLIPGSTEHPASPVDR
jgi:hypothetical protein